MVFQAIDCEHVDTDAILHLGRVVSGKLRPIKVILSDRSSKAVILRKSRDMRMSDDFKRVFISNDRTKLQQPEWSELRKELVCRKELGEDVVIYNGKLASRSSLKIFRIWSYFSSCHSAPPVNILHPLSSKDEQKQSKKFCVWYYVILSHYFINLTNFECLFLPRSHHLYAFLRLGSHLIWILTLLI